MNDYKKPKDAPLSLRVPMDTKRELYALARLTSERVGFKVSLNEYVANALARHVATQRLKYSTKNIPIRGGK